MSYATLAHRFDVLAAQVAYELPEVEASHRSMPATRVMASVLLRFWIEARAKRFDLGVVGNVLGVHKPLAAEELASGIVLDGPFDLAVGEMVEPLEEEGPKVDTQPEFSAESPLALGSGIL
jgi:hypothetical protein